VSESDSNEIPIYRCSCHGARSGSENLQMHEAWDAVSLSKQPWRAAVGTEHIRRSQGDCSCGYKQARSAPDALDERLRLQGGGSHLRFTRWQHCLCRAWIQPHGDGSASKAWREVFPPRCPRRSVWPIAAVIPRSRRYVRCRRRYGPNMVSDGGLPTLRSSTRLPADHSTAP
jgi:hypothetical protein